MKQLTIFCSADLSDLVRDALIHAGIQGFIKVPHAVGSKPDATWEHGRYPTWEAEIFMTPAPDEAVERVVAQLKDHCGKCEIEPCLHILVSALEAVY